MSTEAMAIPQAQSPIAWRRPAIAAVAVGLVALGVLFADEGRSAVRVWSGSTAYGHCYFIIPIALFLAWERRAIVAATPVRPMPAAALAALPLGLVWLVAERLGIMEGQQIIAMGFVELLFVVVLGWRLWRALAAPLLYLGFLVPFGAFITPALQNFTAHFITIGLDVLGIANFSDGNVIEIPEGGFFVAEACAGLRFLIASIAFGVLYACMIYRSPGKRVAFIAASMVIPIIANGFRGLGIVILGHVLGSAEAAAVDHIVYGWVFFSFVILLLIAAGLPFREDNGPLPVPARSPGAVSAAPSSIWAAAAVVLALTAIAPAVAGWFDARATATPLAAGPGPLAGCTPDQGQPIAGPGRLTWSFVCPVGSAPVAQLQLSISAFSPRSNAGAMARLLRQVTGEIGAESSDVRTLRTTDAATWRLVTTTEPDRLTATAQWVDGRPATGGLAQRRLQAWNSVAGSNSAPILVAIATPPTHARIPERAQRQIEQAMLGLLDRNPGLIGQLMALAGS